MTLLDKLATEVDGVLRAAWAVVRDPLAWAFFLAVYGPVLYCMWLMELIG